VRSVSAADPQVLPEKDPEHSQYTEYAAEHEARGKLAQKYPPPVAHTDLFQRERADDERGRLGERALFSLVGVRIVQRSLHDASGRVRLSCVKPVTS
jgi:hypothetical protein